ncbi:MAG: response regulator [Bermanella sp.]
MKFLIVDDSLAMQTIVRRTLEKAGYRDNEFKMASDGLQALDIIRDWEPDLVITDWHMPNMSGLELLNEIKSQMLDLKVGLVTAETNPKRVLEARQAGALFVLHKPFDLQKFQEVILPIVQGSVEGEALLTNYDSAQDNTRYELKLPSIPSLRKILDGFTLKSVNVKKAPESQIDYQYLPYVMALFNDREKDVIKALCILDIRAAVILGCAFDNAPTSDVVTAIKNKSLDKRLLDNNKRLLKMISALFYDPSSEQDLDLKGVHLIPKPFDRLDKLGSSSSDKRLDLTISVEGYGEGQIILMPVAD